MKNMQSDTTTCAMLNMRFAAVTRVTGILLLAALVLPAFTLPGCVTTGQEAVPQHPDNMPLDSIRDVPRVGRVSLVHGQLRLSYAAAGEQHYAAAMLEPISSHLLTAVSRGLPVRLLVPVTRSEVEDPPAGNRPVAVQGTTAWQTLLDDSLQVLAPVESGYGAVVDILEQDELFIYRLGDGSVVAVPVIFKPQDMVVQHTYHFADLLEVMRARLAGHYQSGDRLLFETGDENRHGYPFVYADVSSGKILFLQRMTDSDYDISLPLGTTLEVFFHTLIDHARAFFNQPFSSFSRLFTMAASTTADLARPTPLALLEREPVPPLYRGEGMDLAEWEASLDHITGTQASAGRLAYRVGGAEFFPRLIDLVGSASESILLRVYIFDNDDYAMKFADLLKRRSGEVDVRVLVDGLGTRGAKLAVPASQPPGHEPEFSIVRYLEQDSAVRVRTVANVWLTGDHTKTVLIDDRVAFLGGMNIGREYRYDWHDLMVEVEGPVVSEIGNDFERAWIAAGLLGDIRQMFYREQGHGVSPGEANYPVRLLFTRPGDAQILRAQIAATRKARQHIFLENPYITSDAMVYELVKARRRGVDVRVIMPYESDSGLITRSNVLTANAMLRNGIRVFIYPGMSHLKAAIYDGWACLGSANMDNLSLRMNREMNLATSHPPAVDELFARVFAPDMERAVELTEPLPSNWSDYLAELLADSL
jgi:cardiolipin synthase